MKNKTVFVLGAGFSKEAGFPLTKEFTDEEKIKQLREKLDELEQKRLDKVTEYFFNRIDEKYCKKDIESVLNHVAVADYLVMEATAKDDETYPSNQIFKDLLWYLARMLKERSQCSIPKEYEKFIRYVYTNNFSIISFNYDLVIEKILRKINVEWDYGFDTVPVENSLFLMKMHGSVNWAYCLQCKDVVMFPDYEASSVLENKSTCSVCKEPTLETVIIPPILYKDIFYKHPKYEDVIRQLWGFANDELADADNIVFIGFSMAETDAYAQELFKLSSNMNKGAKYKLVTRPKSKEEIQELKERYERVLIGNEVQIIPKSFCQYTEELN